jgi:hypothetical protein
MRNILLDTGPFVALLDSSEKNHERCVQFFKEFKGRFLTTEPVLTEVLYLLGPSIKPQRAGIEFILRGGAMLVPQSQESLRRGLELMEKIQRYSDGFCRCYPCCPGRRNGNHRKLYAGR